MANGAVSATSQQEFSDADFRIVDNGDQSKKLAFDVSGLTTATTRTWTAPDADGTVYVTGNIIGTVSESSGIPTGALFEEGSNANGYYARFASGLQICRHSLTSNASGATAIPLPANFADTNYSPVVSIFENTNAVRNIKISNKSSAGGFSIRLTDSSGSVTSLPFEYIAIGRWFT